MHVNMCVCTQVYALRSFLNTRGTIIYKVGVPLLGFSELKHKSSLFT